VVGMVFDSVGHALSFYQKYALSSGFSVRKNTTYVHNGFLKLQYFVCSKEGFKRLRAFDGVDDEGKGKGKVKRRKPSKRIGCDAHLHLRLNRDIMKYVVYSFKEEHNHSFVAKEDVQFLTSARRVDYIKESAIQALSSINLGPVRAFNIMRTLYGGYEDIGATKSDFKNYKRDLNQYIGEYDAEMVIQRLMKKKEYCNSFTCEYTLKEDGRLGGLFWADEVCKRNYMVFGDVVGFDATYRSNK
jgi:ribosomal 50S subunit-recycling heat shock protein